MRLTWLTHPACAVLLALSGACSSIDPGAPTAEVRLLNGSAEFPALDLFVGGQLVAEGITTDQASSFVAAPSGSQMIVPGQAMRETCWRV
jgi:hypothetical protein